MQYPVDVMWAYALPTQWQTPPPSYNPAGLPALMAFADAPYPFNGSLQYGAWATLYAQPKGDGMTSNTSSWSGISATASNSGWYSDTGTANSPTTVGDSSLCTAFTYNYACTFTSILTKAQSNPFTMQVDLAPIPNFFGSQSTINLN
jgi:hypothetical protein